MKASIHRWLVYTGLFGIAGGLASYAIKTTRDAMACAAQEIEKRKEVDDMLRRAEARMHALTDATQQSFVLMDITAHILAFNSLAEENAYTVFGCGMREGDSMYQFVLDRDRAQFAEDFNKAVHGEIVTVEKSFLAPSGAERWFSFTYSPTRAENGDIIGICFTTVEISERKQVEQALRTLSRAVEQSPASIVITNLEGMIEYVNPRFTQVTGYTFSEAVGQNPRILKTDETPLGTHSDLWSTLTAGKEWRGEFVNRRKDGSLYYEAATISPIVDPDGVTTHYLAVKEDITERKRAEDALRFANEQLQLRVAEVERLQAELREQALHDPLTGLHNRRYLGETLDREIMRAGRDGDRLSLIVADIDYFKQLNDSYGHQAGDIFLVEIARLMKRHARGSDVVCRYGGEEFLLVLPGASAAIAEQRAEAIRRTCAEISIRYEGVDLTATMSFGVATYPDHGRAADEIIMKADKALYTSKRDGRDRVTVWDEDRVLAG